MQGWPWNKGKSKPGDPSWRQRRVQRYGADSVRCALGQIVDLSSAGMAVRCAGKPPVKPGGTVPVHLKFSDGTLKLTAQVRWCKRCGLKSFAIGLQFVELKPGVGRVLEAIARFGMAEAVNHMGADPASNDEPPKQEHDQNIQAEIDLPNYFRTLELDPDATPEQIKASYRRLAAKYHPDRNDDPEALKRFAAINEAYSILVDADRRGSYRRMMM